MAITIDFRQWIKGKLNSRKRECCISISGLNGNEKQKKCINPVYSKTVRIQKIGASTRKLDLHK
jgi:hypothetical protein